MTIATRPMTLGDYARIRGVPAWMPRKLYERGVLPEPDRAGRYRLLTQQEVVALDIAMRRAGYLCEREGSAGASRHGELCGLGRSGIIQESTSLSGSTDRSLPGPGTLTTPEETLMPNSHRTPSDVREFLSSEQVEAEYNLDARHLLRWCKSGRFPLPAIRLSQRTYRWSRDDIEAWLERQAKRPQRSPSRRSGSSVESP